MREFRPPRRWLYISLVFLCLVIYGNSLKNGFVFDDHFTVLENTLIRSWKNLPQVFTRNYFKQAGEGSYRPVVTLTYFLDYSLWKNQPFGYHLTNLLLHLANVLLLFRVFGLFLSQEQAFSLAVLYAVFPVNAEAINAISFREDLLVVFFGLLSFLSHLSFSRQGKKRFLCFSLLGYLLASLSKENGVILPLLFLAYGRAFQSGHRQKKFWIISGLCYAAVFLLFLILRFGLFRNPVQEESVVAPGPLAVRVFAVPLIILQYLRILLVPYPLLAEYPPVHSGVLPGFVYALFFPVVLVFSVGLIKSYRQDRVIFFGCLWFLFSFLPVSNLYPLINPVAERYLYLPAIGFLLIVVQLVWKIKKPKWRASTLVLLAGTYLVLTAERNQVWKDDLTLWKVTCSQQSVPTTRAYCNLGKAWLQKGQVSEAITCYLKALEIKPDYHQAHYDLANLYAQSGNLEAAVTHYLAALSTKPGFVEARVNLANILARQGKREEALVHYSAALKAAPDSGRTYFNRAVTYFEMARYDQAWEDVKASQALGYPVNPEFIKALQKANK